MDNRPRRRPNTNIDGFVNSRPVVRKPDKPEEVEESIRIPVKISQDKATSPPIGKLAGNKSMLHTTIPGKLNSSMKLNMPSDNTNSKPKKKRSKKKLIWLSVLAVFVLAIGGAGWDAWQLYHKLHKLSVGNLATSVGGAENILVAGSTNRCNLKVQNNQWGFCSQGVTGVNSDIIFIVHLVPSTHTVSLLSIPRDTFVPNARSGNEAFKIDAALYQGPTQLVDAVEQDFGIPIQHYVEVGFDGFVNIVNAIGGLKMNFPMPVFDSESYLNVTQPGCHVLNGVEALQVVRARHLQYKPPTVTTNNMYYWPQEAQSDIARIARTHEFLRVLASSTVAKGVTNPITDQKLIDAIAPQVQVDNGFSTSTMLELLQDFHSVSFNNVPQFTLPVATANIGSYDYEGTDMGDVVFPIEQTDQQVIDQFLGTKSTVNTMNGSPLPTPPTVSVNVINGSGISDQATTVSSDLQKLGFTISATPTSKSPVNSQAQETVVNYASQATVGEALAVASKLTGYVILSQNPALVSPNSSVTVVTGTGSAVTPAATPTTATTGSSTVAASSSPATTSSSSTSSTSSQTTTTTALGSISPSNQPLAAWDPRDCSLNQAIVPNNPNI